jgi:hypothetical protein
MIWKSLLILCTVIIALNYRLGTMARIPEHEWHGTENERVAESLVHGEGFANPFGSETGPTAHVAPLYPALLATIYGCFGDYHAPTGRLVQQGFTIAVSISIILLLPLAASALGLRPAAGWLAALLMAWLPANRDNEATGHHEQILAGLLLLGAITAVAIGSARRWQRRDILLASVLTALLALGAPNLLLAVALMLTSEIIVCQGPARRRAFVAATIVAGCSLLAVTPWLVRNYLVLGEFVPIRSNFGLELAIGNRPSADGHTYVPEFFDIHPFGSRTERERVRSMGELAYMKMKQAEGRQWIETHPGRFAWLTLRRAWLFWFTTDEQWYELSAEMHRKSRIYGLIGLLVLFELGRLCWQRRPAGRLLSAAVFGAMLPYLLTHVEMRYRFPIVGLFALLSCNAIVAMAAAVAAAVGRKIATGAGDAPFVADRVLTCISQPRGGGDHGPPHHPV